MKRRKIFRAGLAVLLGLLLLVVSLMQPVFRVAVAGRTLLALPLTAPQAFSIHFIHSVQKTPVEENLVADGRAGEFRLLSTRYQSFGVGLPFLASEGTFREEGDAYVMDGMNRHFPSISLRTGVGTELRLTTEAGELRLYELFPPGTRIDLSIVPGLQIFY